MVDELHDAQAAFPRLDAPEMLLFAVRDWLAGQGFLPAAPDVPAG